MDWFLAHLAGDYIFQTDFMASGKKTKSWICAVHVLFYLLPFGPWFGVPVCTRGMDWLTQRVKVKTPHSDGLLPGRHRRAVRDTRAGIRERYGSMCYGEQPRLNPWAAPFVTVESENSE